MIAVAPAMPMPTAAENADAGDAAAAAEAVGLRYVTDQAPGIRRIRAGEAFGCVRPDGRAVSEQRTLARIAALAIPPAWTDVWICPDPNGHIQATARDAKGRKQYRYHARWREARDATKFHRMLAFGRALPAMRSRVDQDLARRGVPRAKVLATVVRLLETTRIRVGNTEYARANGHYGLTTLENDHVRVDGTSLTFRFRGKSGKEHTVGLRDRRLAGVVRRCQELPGHHLFEYLDDDGALRAVGSADVNAYLREISGEDFTAKDFRTWAGTVLAAQALLTGEVAESPAAAKRNIVQAIVATADRLGNTPAICRRCYVHPAILDAYLDGSLGALTETSAETPPGALSPEEAAVLALLAASERPN